MCSVSLIHADKENTKHLVHFEKKDRLQNGGESKMGECQSHLSEMYLYSSANVFTRRDARKTHDIICKKIACIYFPTTLCTFLLINLSSRCF